MADWKARDITTNPVVYDLIANDGRLLTSVCWDRNALYYGAYITPDNRVREPRFDDALEAATKLALDQMEPDEVPDRFSRGARRATAKRQAAGVLF